MSAAIARLNTWTPASRAEQDLVLVARLMLGAALERQESRGAHFRSDFPQSRADAPRRSFTQPDPSVRAPFSHARSRVA
jgi:L-aspartate oxidase